MPIYEYQCPDCGNAWSDLVPSASSPVPECPSCRSAKTEKLFSVFASQGGETGAAAHAHAAPGPSCGPSTCGCGRFH